ncbi:type I 3-dehydroquinate dehydratase [Streptococcus tangpeifui]|uniref:3-dehydroquinate dehydratase n=1 Tax=Streptococcus criceti HS-6 TaxID=873449 RepID=G5JQA6_STRCG|nr:MULTISPECIES: type I 3-dehydroquinate dehydratase [Streptococcus]EHI75369.1 putative 3-dehydroquinate dehydratase [Streptococcus criceti HS-6]
MKIVVPVMPRSLDEVNQLDAAKYDHADIIEWRADFLPKDDIIKVAPAIFEKFPGREIIFTLRTQAEGGQISLPDEEYVSLIKEVSSLYHPDYIDFEYYSHQDIFSQMLEFPNLILSYHNFEETPDNLMSILSELTTLTPRVVKVAVMPQTEQDVLDLMNFTRGFKVLNPEQDYVTMAMGKLGQVSRLASDLMGSSWTFASVDEASAPGQIGLADMFKVREILDAD